MKKIIVFLGLFLFLGSCSNSKEVNSNKLVIGASSVPHAEILEFAKPLLKEKGIDLEIKVFDDYILPNKALQNKDLDGNYFQHIPYLESQNKEFNYGFVNAGGIHIEPIGIYSKKYKSLKELPDGSTFLISNSTADHGRILTLLQNEGLIKIKSGIDTTTAQIDDIIENKHNFKFNSEFDASLLAKLYKEENHDAVLINTNYAISNNIDPKTAIAAESANSPYVNIIAVRKGDETKDNIKVLVEVLHSKEVQDFINEKYNGAVVPVK